MTGIWGGAFWKATAERAIKTFAQTLAALLVADGTGLLDSQWVPRLSVAGMAALVSVLTSIGSDSLTGTGPAIAGPEVIPDEAVPPPGITAVYSSDTKADATGYEPKHDRP